MSDTHLSRGIILVVDDDQGTQEFYQDLLTMEGYRVVTATSGQAALSKVASQPIDTIVLAERLPDMPGIEVCRQLRAGLAPTVPILLVTADRFPQHEDDIRRAGATDVLGNPFDLSEFLDRVAALVAP